MAVIDLSQLPAPDVVETLDFEAILAERKATLISLYPEDEQEAIARTLTLESDPLVKYLEENAYREVILRQRINEAAKAGMVAYAIKNDLEQLAANNNVERLVITPRRRYPNTASGGGHGIRQRFTPACTGCF